MTLFVTGSHRRRREIAGQRGRGKQMEPVPCGTRLGQLSEIILDTLKTISRDSVVITPRLLEKSLSGREDLIALLESAPLDEAPANTPIPSPKPNRLTAPAARIIKPRGGKSPSEREDFLRFREFLMNVVEDVEETAAAQDLPALNDMRADAREAARMDQLLDLGDGLYRIVRSQFNRLSGELSQVTRLLAHAADGILEMEKCILEGPADAKPGLSTDDSTDGAKSHTPGAERAAAGGRDIRELKSRIEGRLPLLRSMLEQRKQRAQQPIPPAELDGLKHRITDMKDQLGQARRKTQVLEIGLFRDPLTGVYNRRACKQRMAVEFKNYRRTQQVFCAIAVEVRDFQNINDGLGYAAGDHCLKELAAIIKDSLRGSDFLARCSGGGFAAILPRTPENIIPIVTERLRRNVEKARFRHQGREFAVEVGIGAAFSFPADESPDEVLLRAEKDLLAGKEAGRSFSSQAAGRRNLA